MNNISKLVLLLGLSSCVSPNQNIPGVITKVSENPYVSSPSRQKSVKVELKLQKKEVVEEKPSCNNLKIGIVGASNTVENKYRDDLDDLIEAKCSGTNVVIYAKGATGPRAQRFLVGYMLEKHPDLDYVILNPSENDMVKYSLEVYTKDVLHLASLVKKNNPDTKVIILTNTPSKGHSPGRPWGWTEEVQKKKVDFNSDLLNNRLGIPDLVDYGVNTYSPLQDPIGSETCGKYCTTFKDKIHLNTVGMQKVSEAILTTVFENER